MNQLPAAVFVYGTLKRGEERAGCWPRIPRSVVPATVVARLFDLGPYPALLPGESNDQDIVLGELWRFDPADLAETLRVLDEVECYGVDDVDLYERRIVTCSTLTGETVDAHCYFLADPQQAQRSRRMPPDARGWCEWRGS